jgi:hypothetical protein
MKYVYIVYVKWTPKAMAGGGDSSKNGLRNMIKYARGRSAVIPSWVVMLVQVFN